MPAARPMATPLPDTTPPPHHAVVVPSVDLTKMLTVETTANGITGASEERVSVTIPRLVFGRGRWRVLMTELRSSGPRDMVFSDNGVGFACGHLFSPFGARHEWTLRVVAELIDWEPDPVALSTFSASALAPFLESPHDRVRVAAVRALAFAHGEEVVG